VRNRQFKWGGVLIKTHRFVVRDCVSGTNREGGLFWMLDNSPARPYESCKIFKGRPRRNAFSKLVHRQYKSFPPDRFCQVEIKKTTELSNKHRTA